jgi:hypothetical protein
MSTAIVIVAVGVAILVIGALALTNPMMKKREEAAVKATTDKLGKGNINLIEPRTTAMGTDPDDGTGLRGMSCLAATDDQLLAVSWAGLKEWSIPRSSITAIDTAAEDPTAVQKVSIMIAYAPAGGEETTATFRLKEPVAWLKELGFDWGPDGPPPDEPDEDDDASHDE